MYIIVIAIAEIAKRGCEMKHNTELAWDKIKLDFIKNKRVALGYSLQDMAETLDFKNASTYLKYEIGVYLFKANHLPALAIKLHCNIENFFESNFAELAKFDSELITTIEKKNNLAREVI